MSVEALIHPSVRFATPPRTPAPAEEEEDDSAHVAADTDVTRVNCFLLHLSRWLTVREYM